MSTARRIRGFLLVGLCALSLGAAAAPAQAERALFNAEVLHPEPNPLGPPTPPPDGQVEAPCGVALLGGGIYVPEYYRSRIDVFDSGGVFGSQFAAPNAADGVCGLASSVGALYGNEWHESVVRLLPSFKAFDTGHESTGVAVD